MYNNIANKIKGFAKATGILALLAGVIVWIYLGTDIGFDELIPWLCLISGILLFFFSWIVYGFGQLVGDTEEIKDKMNAAPAKAEDALPEL